MAYRDEVYQKFKQEFLCIEQPASPQLGDNDKEADGAVGGMDREPSCTMVHSLGLWTQPTDS